MRPPALKTATGISPDRGVAGATVDYANRAKDVQNMNNGRKLRTIRRQEGLLPGSQQKTDDGQVASRPQRVAHHFILENDCEDQGFTKRSDGCFACLPSFDHRGKPVRPKIIKKEERGFLLWACEKCGGNYGIIRTIESQKG